MKQPENILVDYEIINDEVQNFACYLGDWSSSGCIYPGGTPMYAGPRIYEADGKDFFTFGRLVSELFLQNKGKLTQSEIQTKVCFANTFC